jgi:hypothetical protein
MVPAAPISMERAMLFFKAKLIAFRISAAFPNTPMKSTPVKD